ncbi:MAG: hypothetical protein NDJ92_16285, partial [Thermoanaerobaculia bacterium]|nr:hypothetical protein [Thermoanaerobaculia bacterium]
AGAWESFRWQYGPHRLGIGILLLDLVASLTRWSSRAEAFTSGAIFLAAAVSAVALKFRLFKTLGYADVAILFIYMSLFHVESLVIVPNPSHGSVPTLLLLWYCAALMAERPVVRYTLVLTLNFVMIYTGFGIFVAPITVGLLALAGWQNRADRRVRTLVFAALAIAVLSAASFFVGYRFDPASPDWSFSASDVPLYPVFAGLMLASFWGVRITWLGTDARASQLGEWLPTIAGLALLAMLVVLFVIHVRRIWRDGIHRNPLSLVSVVLVGFTLLFCFNTAVGRFFLGLEAAQESRYHALLLPAGLALYLNVLTLARPNIRLALVLLLVCAAVVGVLPIGIVDDYAGGARDSRIRWRDCYLRRGDIERCNREAAVEVFPYVEPLAARLEFLKRNRLNLFAEERASPPAP